MIVLDDPFKDPECLDMEPSSPEPIKHSQDTFLEYFEKEEHEKKTRN
jgi:hypothetical protein